MKASRVHRYFVVNGNALSDWCHPSVVYAESVKDAARKYADDRQLEAGKHVMVFEANLFELFEVTPDDEPEQEDAPDPVAQIEESLDG